MSAQTNFAELVEQAQANVLDRSIVDLPGSFNKKEVKGTLYWYWQFRDLEGKLKQIYIGPDDERLRELIARRTEAQGNASDNQHRLAAACTALGCQGVLRQHFRVINRMAEHGFFGAGGVLIGTHALIAMSNMLGVTWTGGWRTNDIDFARAGKNVSLALPTNAQSDVHDAITSLEMGLLPARSITTGEGATYLKAGQGELRIDLLTVAGRSDNVYRHEPLNVNLQPMKFMEFSLEKTTQTVVLSGEDAVVVNVPSPSRYALHKLIVMAEREDSFRAKIAKDAGQVATLVSYALERTPHALKEAAADLMDRGKGWRSRAAIGLQQLTIFHPGIAHELAGVLSDRPVSRRAAAPVHEDDGSEDRPRG